ncbi:MAG TPA: hypothetical protein VLV49_16405 [Terriglobales bacterium]|nr:hypothetical protein [Terriglobales bacterium]
MKSAKLRSRGFTLIASLMLMLLMSGIAIGMLMMVNSEAKVGTNDLENNLAYHDAEGAVEKMTSDLADTFQNIESPTAAQIAALGNNTPTNDPGVTYPDYSLTAATNTDGSLASSYGQISSGPYQGLYAQIIPVTLLATAKRPLGDEATMTRTVEVALIPVFQFGVFSDGDLGFFSSPDLTFEGRVHTNGDLYVGVANGYNLIFDDKITVWGNVINQVFPNGMTANSSNNDGGPVYVATASQGCYNYANGGKQGSYCTQFVQTPSSSDGSVTGDATSAQNSNWSSVKSTFNSYVLDGDYGITEKPGGNGAKNLSLPFVSGTTFPYQIIRRPPTNESTSSLLGSSRLANQAQIRVLLSDQENDLHLPGWDGDKSNDIQLGNPAGNGTGDPSDATGWKVYDKANSTQQTSGYYFAWANTDSSAKNPGGTAAGYDPDFVNYLCGDSNLPVTVTCLDNNKQWPLIGGWLRVEERLGSAAAWVGITKEWLGYGFARGTQVPNAESSTANSVNPNAILIFQEQADRNGDGAVSYVTSGSLSLKTVTDTNGHNYVETNSNTGSPFNWYPINLYDAREGEAWDVSGLAAGSCTANGIMNAVELDVGNLRQWLLGQGAYKNGTGPSVDSGSQNGYILYFSDRRGEQMAQGATALAGEYGFEDTINLSNKGMPDKGLEPALPVRSGSGRTALSPEDVNENGGLDIYGVKGVGDAYGSTYANDTDTANPPNPYKDRISSCYTTGRKNRVTGARHVLKLVDGGMTSTTVSPLPTKPDGTGGFTVASENPVYIQGDYNSSSVDPMWKNPTTGTEPKHAAAGIIADAVSVLSNNWQDAGFITGSGKSASTTPGSMLSTIDDSAKNATDTYYRVAIAAGKAMNFYNPTGTPDGYFGTDGGLHNFLRFLEDWSNATLYYKGSLVSLYYSTYATGTFKCCNIVYHPPTRKYYFDPLFASPQNLPPGTPMFRDVDNLSYRQIFTARTY